MRDLIPAMEQALTAFSAGQVQQPVRTALLLERQAGFFGIMPAVLDGGMGLKAVTFYPGNAARNLPTHMATIFLADPETGAPLALMDRSEARSVGEEWGSTCKYRGAPYN